MNRNSQFSLGKVSENLFHVHFPEHFLLSLFLICSWLCVMLDVMCLMNFSSLPPSTFHPPTFICSPRNNFALTQERKLKSAVESHISLLLVVVANMESTMMRPWLKEKVDSIVNAKCALLLLFRERNFLTPLHLEFNEFSILKGATTTAEENENVLSPSAIKTPKELFARRRETILENCYGACPLFL